MNEAQAIKMCLKDKDPMGFEYLVEQYKREAFYHALSFTNNKADAERMGGNAVIGVRMATAMVMDGAAEMVAHGTAVVAEDDD